ncbi:MAG: aldehyde dehydrogenase family protein [Phycisphaeraceae bacterium]|nr:aldehyde dehydrogenase family protein [Phycisphaeraceae bacterium]
MNRLPVVKTHKLFIGGSFPRTESGRSRELLDLRGEVVAHLCRASRKDLRSAVEAARAAQPAWQAATPYLRGQVLHRFAEMLEGRRAELADALRTHARRSAASARAEVDAAIDRLLSMAGWSDKLAMVLGGQNPVAGPYYNFTVPEATGVVTLVDGSHAPLLGAVSLLAPALVAGNAVILVASEAAPLPALLLAESAPTSDLPPGVFNLLTGEHGELVPHIASHRDIDGVLAAVEGETAAQLRKGSAENLKRVRIIDPSSDFFAEEPWSGASAFESLVEFKTIWHPAAT